MKNIVIILGLSAILFACADVNGNNNSGEIIVENPQTQLVSLSIAGMDIEPEKSAASPGEAPSKAITLKAADAADAEVTAVLEPEGSSAAYGKMANDNDMPVMWTTIPASITFKNNDIFTIRVRDKNGNSIYYKFNVSVEGAGTGPVEPVDPPGPESELLGKVIILQAYGTGTASDGGVSHSFIELYNNTDEEVDLSGHWLHYSEGGASWRAISLENKKIPAWHSFLITGKMQNNKNDQTGTGLLVLDQADISVPDLQMNNKAFKIFISNTNQVKVVNPFDSLGDKTGVKASGYVDLLGANDDDLTASIDSFETANPANTSVKAPYLASKGKSVRRIDLRDTDDNNHDFEQIEWRLRPARPETWLSPQEFDAFRPRSVSSGAWNPVQAREDANASNANLIELIIAGQPVNPGSHAGTYSEIESPGAVSITNLIANSVQTEITAAAGAAIRTAKTKGSEVPVWESLTAPIFSFSDGDILYIEITSRDGTTKQVYKIVVTVTEVSGSVTVSGTYALDINSTIPQERVSIEAYINQNGTSLISRADANMQNKTWTLSVPAGQPLWFKVAVTDTSGFSFGKIVSTSAQTFNSAAQNVSLALGGYALPELKSFMLLAATASGGSKQSKTGTIQADGIIAMPATSYNTTAIGTLLNFHSMIAEFELSADSRLFVGSKEQISGVTPNNYYNDVIFTVVADDNTRKTYTVAGRTAPSGSSASGKIVGTTNFQTQGFGVINITTTDKTLGLPTAASTTKLNVVWNTTGSYTYIGPEGNILTGGTDIKVHGNQSLRNDSRKSYSLKLNSAAGFEYYDYKTRKYITLPAHKRWVLMAHPNDASKLKTPTGFEMGRRVLDKLGWQPHADFVFLFLNDEYKGVYILSEVIKIDPGRLNITPEASLSNPNGGWIAELNNVWWYTTDGNSNQYIFDELYNFMTSHQNPVSARQQGIVFSFSSPDERMGWYEPEPPLGDGNLTYSSNTFMPRKAIVLAAKLGEGALYNRASTPASQWIVPNDFGETNGMGSAGMLQTGTFGQNNGGIAGSRTLAQVFPDYETSLFVKLARRIQDTEDAIYAHKYTGEGSYHDYIDIDSFIDFQIAFEMSTNWEFLAMNGQYMHFDPKAGADGKGRIKMGPIWDLDFAWSGGSTTQGMFGGGTTINTGDFGTAAGFTRKAPFWYKELLGWQNAHNGGTFSTTNGTDNPDRKDPYYAQRLKERWNAVKTQFSVELNPYIDAQYERLSRIVEHSKQNYSSATITPSNALKTTISNRISQLDTVINGY